jgi:hypothetical protein
LQLVALFGQFVAFRFQLGQRLPLGDVLLGHVGFELGALLLGLFQRLFGVVQLELQSQRLAGANFASRPINHLFPVLVRAVDGDRECHEHQAHGEDEHDKDFADQVHTRARCGTELPAMPHEVSWFDRRVPNAAAKNPWVARARPPRKVHLALS